MACLLLAGWLAGGLAGCSTPLPPYTPGTQTPASAPATTSAPLGAPDTRPGALGPPGTPAAPAAPGALGALGALGAPATPGAAGVSGSTSPVEAIADTPRPYSEAVALRFPEPPVKYRTPAFEAGRGAFTSNAEVASWMRGLVRDGSAAPDSHTVRLLSLGSSQSGVPLEALLFTRTAQATPAALLRAGRPTVLLLGQQHGDEPAGAEALLAIAEELAQGSFVKLLEHINVVLLPRANPDGALAGGRGTAGGVNANRDHLLLRTPEAQAMAQLAREYRPIVVVDSHEYAVIKPYLEKFGALQRFDALVQYATVANLPEFITKAAEEWFRRPMLASLNAQGLSTEWFYTASNDVADKKMAMGSVQPDTARNANGLRNSISVLIETRGVGIGRLHLARRVHSHVVAIKSVLESAAQRAADLTRLRKFVDAEVAALACQGQAVVFATATPSEYTLTMLDPVTGADRQLSVGWDSALVLEVRKTRTRPCGYWLGEAQIDAVLRLRGLGVVVQQVQHNGVVRGEVYQEKTREMVASAEARVEARIGLAEAMLRVEVDTVAALIDVSAGSYYVPLDQPLANLALAALEPDSPNSYVAHRVVNAVNGVARVMARPDWRMTALP